MTALTLANIKAIAKGDANIARLKESMTGLSITVASGVATVSAVAHGFTAGESAKIAGAAGADLNGVKNVDTVPDNDSFTFATSVGDGADANNGSISFTNEHVALVLADVALYVPEAHYLGRTELAQRYLGAHLLSVAYQPEGGRGPLSSESVGGVSRSFTLPYLNQKTVLGSTQYGLMFLEIRRSITAGFRVVTLPTIAE